MNKSVCSEMTVAKIMISLFSLVNLSMIASGGIIFTLGLTGYWSADANFSYLMVIMHYALRISDGDGISGDDDADRKPH